MIDDICEYVCTCIPDDSSYYNEILYGNNKTRLPSLIDCILNETEGMKSMDEEVAWECISNAFYYYLCDYREPIVKRKMLRELLAKWLENIAFGLREKLSIEELNSILPNPEEMDLSIEILKELHYAPKGVTKAELAAKYHVSERTIKDIINKIDVDNRDSELRIAGQKIEGKVIYSDICEDKWSSNAGNRYRHFALSSTINPIFLQLNVAQTHSLINALKCSYFEEGRNMSISTAIEIWCQLSNYTKMRIKRYYCSRDHDLYDFVRILEDELKKCNLGHYLSEREQIEQADLSKDEIDEIKNKLEF